MTIAKDFQVLVVGAGPAGCAAAFDLARAGVKVGILESRNFPRVKPCGGALTIKALQALRFSIEPVVKNVVTDFIAGREFTREERFRWKHPIGAMTIRAELDEFVLQKTLDAGATFIKIERLIQLEQSDNSVEVQTDIGNIKSDFLIGADGANSKVRQLIEYPQELTRGFAIEAQVACSSAQDPTMTFDFGVVPRGYGWVFPKGDHYNVGVYTFDARFRLFPEQLRSYIREKLGSVNPSHIVGHSIGFGAWNQAKSGARIFLVGDAGGFCEPILGEGIFYAIKSGQAAAESVLDQIRNVMNADVSFQRRSSYLRGDLRVARKLAKGFYRDLGIGYRLLTSPLFKYALMKGYSSGIPLGHIPANLPRLPFHKVPQVPWLNLGNSSN